MVLMVSSMIATEVDGKILPPLLELVTAHEIVLGTSGCSSLQRSCHHGRSARSHQSSSKQRYSLSTIQSTVVEYSYHAASDVSLVLRSPQCSTTSEPRARILHRLALHSFLCVVISYFASCVRAQFIFGWQSILGGMLNSASRI